MSNYSKYATYTFKVEDKAKTTDERTSSRKELFHRESHGRMKFFLRFCRFGPFNDDMIDDINRCLLPLVHSNEQAIVPDIYMREIFVAYHSGGGRNRPASL